MQFSFLNCTQCTLYNNNFSFEFLEFKNAYIHHNYRELSFADSQNPWREYYFFYNTTVLFIYFYFFYLNSCFLKHVKVIKFLIFKLDSLLTFFFNIILNFSKIFYFWVCGCDFIFRVPLSILPKLFKYKLTEYFFITYNILLL